MDYIHLSHQPSAVSHQFTIADVKELLKDWIKLYPNSFAPDVEFKIYQLPDDDIIIQLHEDMSSLAIALLVLYLRSIDNGQQTTAFITIDDTEVLLKQNVGKRAMIFIADDSQQTTDNGQQITSVRFLLDDNYCLDYDFERKPQPVKNCDLQFEEVEFILPDECEIVKVSDVVKKKIDNILEDDGLTPKKMLIYLLCGAIGLSVGFLIVYFMGK